MSVFHFPQCWYFKCQNKLKVLVILNKHFIFSSGKSYGKFIFLPSRPMVGTLGEKTLRSVFTHSLNSNSSASQYSSSILSYPVQFVHYNCCYPKFTRKYLWIGRSPDDEKDGESKSLQDCPTKSAAPGKLMCWWLMSVMLLWQLLLADWRRGVEIISLP